MDDDSEYEQEAVKVKRRGGARLKSGRPAMGVATATFAHAREILQAVCLEFGVTDSEISGRAVSTNLRAARLEFCHRCAAARIHRPCMARLLDRNLSTIRHFLASPPLSIYAFEDQLTRAREILSAICAEGGFTEEAIRSSSHAGTLPLARREFTRRCKAEKISVAAIAELLGRDHTTVYGFTGGVPGSDGNPALGRLPAILQEVCAKYGVTADALRTRKQSEDLVSARREFCQRCAAENIGITDIAKALHRTRRSIYATLEN